MDSKSYWKNREEEHLKNNLKTEEEYKREINRIYDRMMVQITKEINDFYVKYAKKEGITMAEAKKRVKKLDIEAYAEKAKKYMKNKDFSDEANDEMRLYNLTMKINRLEMLKAQIGLELVDGFDDLQKYFDEKLTERALEEFKRQAGILGETVQNNAERAKVIVNASFHNASFSDRIWMNQTLLKSEISKLLQTGIIQGRNPRVLASELVKKFDVNRRSAERLMITELARVQTESQKQSFEVNDFTEYTFIANGDCCPICAAIDGKHFNVKDMMPGENAAPMHPNCRCSSAPYEDDEEYEAWLEYLDKGGTTEEWKRLKKRNSNTCEPKDKSRIYESKKFTSKELIENSKAVNKLLNEMGLPKSKWSGKTFIKSSEQLPKAKGVKKSSCDIWLREDAEIKTIIHEHLHARSSSWFEKKLRKYRSFEEGSCELLAEEICKQYNISYKPTYAKYVDPLRAFRKMHGEFDSDYDFSVELFKIDMDKREEWLNELASQKGGLKSVALKMLILKVRSGDEK